MARKLQMLWTLNFRKPATPNQAGGYLPESDPVFKMMAGFLVTGCYPELLPDLLQPSNLMIHAEDMQVE